MDCPRRLSPTRCELIGHERLDQTAICDYCVGDWKDGVPPSKEDPRRAVLYFIDLDRFMKGGPPPTTPSPATPVKMEDRLPICEACEYYVDQGCLLCGCPANSLQVKLTQEHGRCPAGKW